MERLKIKSEKVQLLSSMLLYHANTAARLFQALEKTLLIETKPSCRSKNQIQRRSRRNETTNFENKSRRIAFYWNKKAITKRMVLHKIKRYTNVDLAKDSCKHTGLVGETWPRVKRGLINFARQHVGWRELRLFRLIMVWCKQAAVPA